LRVARLGFDVLGVDISRTFVDLRRDASLPEIRRFVDTLGVGPLNRAVMMATFRWMLLKRAYTVDQIRRMAAEAGWRQVRIEVQAIGFEAWMRR
jgi:hypothetical protein